MLDQGWVILGMMAVMDLLIGMLDIEGGCTIKVDWVNVRIQSLSLQRLYQMVYIYRIWSFTLSICIINIVSE